MKQPVFRPFLCAFLTLTGVLVLGLQGACAQWMSLGQFTLDGNNAYSNPLTIHGLPSSVALRVNYVSGYFTNWPIGDERPWWGAYGGDAVAVTTVSFWELPFMTPSTEGYFDDLDDLLLAMQSLPPFVFTAPPGADLSCYVLDDPGATAPTLTQRDGSLTFSVEYLVPEPSAMLLAAVAAIGLLACRRRR